MTTFRFICLAIHLLASAGWFGAMLYSLLVLHPRARKYFTSPADFEEFIAVLSQGARWKVLAALALIAATGIALVFPGPSPSHLWRSIILAKTILFVIALAIFSYASWVLWPRRIFATLDELPRIRRRFRIVAISLLTIAVVSIILGIAARLR